MVAVCGNPGRSVQQVIRQVPRPPYAIEDLTDRRREGLVDEQEDGIEEGIEVTCTPSGQLRGCNWRGAREEGRRVAARAWITCQPRWRAPTINWCGLSCSWCGSRRSGAACQPGCAMMSREMEPLSGAKRIALATSWSMVIESAKSIVTGRPTTTVPRVTPSETVALRGSHRVGAEAERVCVGIARRRRNQALERVDAAGGDRVSAKLMLRSLSGNCLSSPSAVPLREIKPPVSLSRAR